MCIAYLYHSIAYSGVPRLFQRREAYRVVIAFLNLSGDKWLYLSVILIVLCPISFDTAYKDVFILLPTV
jgi:hypothetical protein